MDLHFYFLTRPLYFIAMSRKPLPIGISDFKTIIEGGYAYADKTLFVQELLEKGTNVALIPRPRRFGKTLNLSMLRYFFEKSEEDLARILHYRKSKKKNMRRNFWIAI